MKTEKIAIALIAVLLIGATGTRAQEPKADPANDAALAVDEGFDLSQALGLLLSGQAITRIITGEDP